MRTIILILFLVPTLGYSELVRLDVSSTYESIGKSLKKISATDITPGQTVVGPQGEWPVTGLYWYAREYNVILEVSGVRDKDKVGYICYWYPDDFGHSLMRRENSRHVVRCIVFDTEKRTYTSKKKSWWRIWE